MDKTDYEMLKQRYEGVCKANEVLTRQRNELSEQNRIMSLEKEQWQAEKGKQLAIIQQTLDATNTKMNAILAENSQLKERIRELTNG